MRLVRAPPPAIKERLLKQVRRHLTYANVMSSLAVFLILGGATAFAASTKINGAKIKAGTIVTGKLAKEAVKEGKLGNGAVTESKLADNAVTNKKIADNAVTTSKIADKAVAETKIADNAVTTGKIADNAVTTSKIANNAVNSDKLAANSVTTTKIAADAVTQGKIAPSSIGSSQLKSITVVSATSASTANGSPAGVTATCPSGVVIGGGFETAGAGAAKWIAKRLLREGNGWRVFALNESGGNSTITAFAYCLVP